MTHTAFFVSDRTGITAETLGHSLLSQFQSITFEHIILPFIETEAEAQEVVLQINAIAEKAHQKPLVFCTVVKPRISEIIRTSKGQVVDFFNTFIPILEDTLGAPSSHAIGLTHGMHDHESYKIRIDSINYALQCDDGVRTQDYNIADVVLVGVSRSGKTPTCLYLALQFGINAANYPLTEEDLVNDYLPKSLAPFRNKLFGLNIDAQRLSNIRNERRPNSRYASLNQCELEVKKVESLFQKENIHYMSTTNRSVEEIATKILAKMQIQRRLL